MKQKNTGRQSYRLDHMLIVVLCHIEITMRESYQSVFYSTDDLRQLTSECHMTTLGPINKAHHSSSYNKARTVTVETEDWQREQH